MKMEFVVVVLYSRKEGVIHSLTGYSPHSSLYAFHINFNNTTVIPLENRIFEISNDRRFATYTSYYIRKIDDLGTCTQGLKPEMEGVAYWHRYIILLTQ
jgi:hypothetical protein